MAIFQGTVAQIENNKYKVNKIVGAGENEYPTCKAVEEYVSSVYDQSQIVSAVLAALPTWEGGSY